LLILLPRLSRLSRVLTFLPRLSRLSRVLTFLPHLPHLPHLSRLSRPRLRPTARLSTALKWEG